MREAEAPPNLSYSLAKCCATLLAMTLLRKLFGTFVLVFWLPYSFCALRAWSKALSNVWQE